MVASIRTLPGCAAIEVQFSRAPPMPFLRPRAAPTIPGIWFYLGGQSMIIGLLFGLFFMLLSYSRRNSIPGCRRLVYQVRCSVLPPNVVLPLNLQLTYTMRSRIPCTSITPPSLQ